MSAELAPAREETVLTLPPSIPELIQRYLNGESTESLRKEANVSRRTIYNWMHSELSDEHYPDLVKQAIVNRIADADEKLANAQTALQIAQAREEAKFARWDAERRLKLFRQVTEQQHKAQIQVIVQRETPQPVVVEAEQAVKCLVSPQEQAQ